ncbi:MAG: hypothetical protein ACQEW5_02835 [Bacillota bacterium]
MNDYLIYPKQRKWEVKVFAMPNIPRGINRYQESLKIILNSLENNTPYNTVITIPGSDRKMTLDNLCVTLRPTGIVHNNNRGWELSSEAKVWLESNDNLYLAAFLNANIRFFSEILSILQSPNKASEILNIANNDYKLNWKTKNEVNSRLKWLQDLGLVDYQDFTLKYSTTELGEKFLEIVGYVTPDELDTNIDTTLNETTIPISDWALKLLEMTELELTLRKTSIGYIAGGVESMHNTISDYVLLMNSPTKISTIIEYSKETYNISESSTRSYISTLINMGFIHRQTKTLFQTKELGNKFMSTISPLDFACCIHRKFNFVFEILNELKADNLDAKSLAVIAKVSYGFPTENISEIHKRLNILKNANLIQDIGKSSFCLTQRGKNFIQEVNTFLPVKINKETVKQTSTTLNTQNNSSKVDEYLKEIRLSSRDSSNPNRFEKALEKGLKLLGFKTELLGGSGKTDILIQAPTAPKFAYSVAVDAKSTYNGGITEGQINFDTITDHKILHNADFSAVVGPEFQGERLVERAEKHKVILIDIDSLEKLIRLHIEVPLQADSYKKLFIKPGIVDITLIEEDRDSITQDGNLLKAIIECLSEESDDNITQGIIQPREIYQLLKNQQQFTTPPTLEEINVMLEFLSSPLIGCVGHTKEGYFALGSLADAAQKFDFYLNACSKGNIKSITL